MILLISYENYRSNFNNEFSDFQKINLKTGREFAILESYFGPLYNVNPSFPEYENIKTLDDKLLIDALIKLFEKRHQIIQDIIPVKETYFKIQTFKNKQKYNYYIRKAINDNFEIKLISEVLYE